MLEESKDFYIQLSARFNRLLDRAKPEGSRPDVIFHIPIPDSDTIVEGSWEDSDPVYATRVLEKLPELYAAAVHVIQRNPENFFSQMKFLYNPEADIWEINYLIIRKTNRVIKGPRYYSPKHPLRSRLEKAMSEMSVQDEDTTREIIADLTDEVASAAPEQGRKEVDGG